MRILLDTQSWLWMVSAPEQFSQRALTLVAESENELLLSAASVWEIAIKHSIGKLRLPAEPAEYVPHHLSLTRTTPLPIEHVHALQMGRLPHHHRDPFDRMLIAQAQVERLPILTADRSFAPYDVEVIRA